MPGWFAAILAVCAVALTAAAVPLLVALSRSVRRAESVLGIVERGLSPLVGEFHGWLQGRCSGLPRLVPLRRYRRRGGRDPRRAARGSGNPRDAGGARRGVGAPGAGARHRGTEPRQRVARQGPRPAPGGD